MPSKVRLIVLILAISIATFATIILAPPADAQQPIISVPETGDADAPVLDGFWTTSDEWSRASETLQNFTDDTQLVIRGMHNEEFMYILLEMPQDYVVDGRAGICFDTLNDGGPYMKPDDFCFVLSQDLREYHGNDRTTLMHETGLHIYVDARRGLSDSNSPYGSEKDHVTYEFKVPMEYIGAVNQTQYGFYVVFDTRGQTTNYTYYYSWPNYETTSSLRVESPRAWGLLSTSSTAEVPEFPTPLVGIVAGLIGAIVIATRKTRLFRI